VADRLSPPDSISTISMPGWRAVISATAARLMLASSRIAVCGQPPVSTPMIRSKGSTCIRISASASSWV
jgi:hypothetical protein